MTADDESIEALREFVRERFPAASAKGLGDDASLLQSGVVDSLGILEFAAFLEERFSLQLRDDDFTPENFDSIATIARFVDARRR